MELPSQEEEIPLPINSTYVGHGHGHMIHHDPTPSTNGNNHIIEAPYKKTVRYKECLKNHAATMGGNATDGCGEFMPSGEEGTIEALICSACNCHRNFHRKEIEGEQQLVPYVNRVGRKFYAIPSRQVLPNQMIMSYNMGESEVEHEGMAMGMGRPLKKRFRTKFSQEQKDKMLNFAEKVGWKIQKQEEGVVQQFCQEIGVKRRVLKVWMHNNKHSLAKKIIPQNHVSSDIP